MLFLRNHIDHCLKQNLSNSSIIHRIITSFDYCIRFKKSLCLIISTLKSKIFENSLSSSKLQIWNNDDETWSSFWMMLNYDITLMILKNNLKFFQKKHWIHSREVKKEISKKRSKIIFSKWSMQKVKLKACVIIL